MEKTTLLLKLSFITHHSISLFNKLYLIMATSGKMDLRGIKSGFSSAGELFSPIISKETGAFQRKLRVKIPRYEHVLECPSKMISDFLIAEYKFRAMLQLKKRITTSTTTSSTIGSNNPDEGDLPADELKWIGPNYTLLETDFHLKDLSLPAATLSYLRMLARSNPRWYLKTGLVSLCKRTDGCCGQSCGCCEKRADGIPRGSGISGHCSWACPCCEARKGYHGKRLKVGTYIENQYEAALESENPALLLRIANYYFSMYPKKAISIQASVGPSKSKTGKDTKSSKTVRFDLRSTQVHPLTNSRY